MIAFITAFIAAAVALIAFLQWKTARDKVLLDLFEKRFAVYEELRIVVSKFQQKGRLNLDELFEFGRPQAKAKFLFGPEVTEYLEARRVDLIRASHTARHADDVARAQDGRDPVLDRLNRLADFFADFDRLVSPYMSHTQKALSKPFAKATPPPPSAPAPQPAAMRAARE